MRRRVFEVVKRGLVFTTEDFAQSMKNMKSRPTNRHVGDAEYISLEASIPPRPSTKFSEIISATLHESCSKSDYWISYRNRGMEGINELRDVTMKYYEDCGFDVSESKPIFTQSIHNVLHLTLDRLMDRDADQVLMTNPTFGLFFDSIERRGFDIGLINLNQETDFRLTPQILSDALTNNPQAALFIFINPDNPTGVSYSKEELDELAKVFVDHNLRRREAGKKDLLVFSDEASHLVGPVEFDPKMHHSLGSCKGMNEFTITTRSLSKTVAPSFGMCYAIGPNSVISQILDSKDDILAADFGPSYPVQYAAAKILSTHLNSFYEHIKESNKKYSSSMTKVEEFVQSTDGAMSKVFGGDDSFCSLVTRPKGGLQCIVSFPKLLDCKAPDGHGAIKNDIDLAEYFIRTKKVGILPGQALGFDPKAMVFRITISKDPQERLEAGVLRIKDACRDFTPELLLSKDDIELRRPSAEKFTDKNKTKSQDDIGLRR